MERFYGTPFSFFEKYSPVGSPSDIAQWLKPFVESGAKDLNIAPIASSPTEAITGMAELKQILVSIIRSRLSKTMFWCLYMIVTLSAQLKIQILM